MAGKLNPGWRSQLDDDSTSAQYGDVSSQYSPVEDVRKRSYGRQTENLSPRLTPADKPKRPRIARLRQRQTSISQQVQDAQTPPTSQEAAPEIVDLEDGGYDGDAEVQYPDGYEEPESTAEESDMSQLTLEQFNDDDDALAEKLRKLRVRDRKRRSTHPVSNPVPRHGSHRTHKRTHSESFDSLSDGEDEAQGHESVKPLPAPKRRRNQPTQSAPRETDAGDEHEMDLS